MIPQQAADILGIERPWTPSAIKTAYRRRSRDTHPDRGGSDEAFIEVARARETLQVYLDRGLSPDEELVDEDEPWDAWSATAGWEDEDEEGDLGIGTWFDVLRVQVDGKLIDGDFRAQLVELQEKGLNKYGEVIRSRYLIAIYPKSPVWMPGQIAEVVLREEGVREPSVFIRQIRQRCHERDGRINAFWFDPLEEPVIREENLSSHGFYRSD